MDHNTFQGEYLEEILSQIQSDPHLVSLVREIGAGEVLFYEADESTDIYILLEGSLEVRKAGKVIATIEKKGEVFGEMSSLLDKKRTATVKAITRARFLKIPYKDLDQIKVKYPFMYEIISRSLAIRIRKVTDLLIGLREVCDSIPDSVIILNPTGEVSTLNKQAMSLLNTNVRDISGKKFNSLCVNKDECNMFLELAARDGSIREKILKLRTKEGNTIYLSTSISCVKDIIGNISNYLFIMRDITREVKLKERLSKVVKYGAIITLLAVPLLAYLFFTFGHTYQKTKYESADISDVIGKIKQDTKYILSLTGPDADLLDVIKLKTVISELVRGSGSYKRIIILDRSRNVVAESVGEGEVLGKFTTYKGVQMAETGPPFKVLRLFEGAVEGQVGSKRVTQIACRLESKKGILGWVVFQPRDYHIDEAISEFN